MIKRKNRLKDNYIDEFKEWQNHQYDPGYYTGGKIPPYIHKPRYPKIKGVLYIFGGLLILFVLLIPILTGLSSKEDIPLIIIAFILFGLFSFIFIYSGIKYILRARVIKQVELYKKSFHKKKKKNRKHNK